MGNIQITNLVLIIVINCVALKPGDEIPMTSNKQSVNYYAVLGILPKASINEIKSAHRKLAMMYHPDRVHRRIENETNSKYTEEDYKKVYQLINEAWELLSNEFERARYDFIYGFSNSSGCKKTLDIQRQKALLSIKNMEKTAKLKAEEEFNKGESGIIILEAYYGVLPQLIKWNDNIQAQALGAIEDVKIPIEMLIEDSKVEFINIKDCNGEGATLTRIPGFFDVAEGDPKRLIVRYVYWGEKHQLNIADNESLRFPMKNHKVLEDGRTIEMTKNIHCKSRESLRAAIIKDDINSDPSLSIPALYALALIIGGVVCFTTNPDKSSEYAKKLINPLINGGARYLAD